MRPVTTTVASPPFTVEHSAGLAGPSKDHRSPGRAAADQPTVRGPKAMRSWPLLVLAAPAAAEVWSGWVGVAQKTGFGMVSPLPGIWPSLHLDTSITLPVGVECYAALALRAWLSPAGSVSQRTRRFARRSAICSFLLGMAGQVACHLMQQAGMTRAPWAVTTLVSCLPVLVLAMGTALAHMLHDDAATADRPRTDGPGPLQRAWSSEDRDGMYRSGPDGRPAQVGQPGPASGPVPAAALDSTATAAGAGVPRPTGQAIADQARAAAVQLITAGKPITRRALRAAGIRGSNEALNHLACTLRAEIRVACPG